MVPARMTYKFMKHSIYFMQWCRAWALGHGLSCGSKAVEPGNFPPKQQAYFNFMAAVTICSDFGAQSRLGEKLFLEIFFQGLFQRFSPEARRGSQGASRAAPGKSGLHARGEG